MSKLLQAQDWANASAACKPCRTSASTLSRARIYGLIGPNGAGKTTLFNVLTGLYPEDGSCTFNGRSMSGKKPHEVAYAGLARTFQNIRLFANLSAIENVMIGRHMRTRAGVLGAVLLHSRRARRRGRHRGTRPGTAGIRRHRPPRQRRGAFAALRRPAPPGDRARWPPSRSCWRWTNPPPA